MRGCDTTSAPHRDWETSNNIVIHRGERKRLQFLIVPRKSSRDCILAWAFFSTPPRAWWCVCRVHCSSSRRHWRIYRRIETRLELVYARKILLSAFGVNENYAHDAVQEFFPFMKALSFMKSCEQPPPLPLPPSRDIIPFRRGDRREFARAVI